ncbi:MAG: FAD-binding oxidoreductase [Actinobacteria bacterium]|nr:FAD-binding oxidoreductase [Actinomycetota bacterium]
MIGGGALGAATAFHLRRLGVNDVVLVERDALASGSTSKSAGGIRAQFADELNVRIALRSMTEFESMGDEIAWRRFGYLFLLDSDDDLAAFRGALELQRSLGVPSTELGLDEVRELVPQLELEGIAGATFCPLDGYATPEAVVQWYARESRADIRQSCAATGIEVREGRIEAVETTRGRIETQVVVCCAGVWSRDVGAMAGVELPVEGEARSMWFTPEDGGLPARLPLTIDFGSGFYVHREGPGLAFGGRERELEDAAEAAARRLPVLVDLPVQTSWWGWYDVSPDWNALVGEAHGVSRFLYATGFSGHGFQQAPAVGEHLAELVVGKEPTLDLSAFDAARFASGASRPETMVV